MVPVEEKVEGDDGGDDEDRQGAKQGRATAPDRGDDGAQPLRALPDNGAERFLDIGAQVAEIGPKEPAFRVNEERLEAERIVRQALQEAGQLARDEGRHQDEGQRDQKDKEHQDGERRRQTAEPPSLQTIGQRVEQIGDRHAEDER